MEVIFGDEEIKNESDVEQKQLYPLLRGVLGFFPSQIRPKDYFSPRDIGKGKKRKQGYYPDYGIVIQGLVLVIVEAKSPNETAEQGYEEATLYALELNKNFPEDNNPTQKIISSNGKTILAGPWDSEPLVRMTERDFFEGNRNYQKMLDFLSRAKVEEVSKQIMAEISPRHRFKPLRLLGGPAKRNRELPPNRFAKEIIPYLQTYLNPNYNEASREVIEKAYVSTVEITRYDGILEELLRDNLAQLKTPGAREITTTETEAFDFKEIIKTISEKGISYRSPFILIIGGVGVGKSMFIDRFFSFLIDPDLKEAIVISKVDFNKAPAELEGIDDWICVNFLEDLKLRPGTNDLFSYEKMEEYFEERINIRKEGPYKLLFLEQPEEYRKRIADDLKSWVDDPKILSEGVIKYFSVKESKPVIVIFDNIDKRGKDQQLKVFQAVQSFREFNNCFCILALRDETYDRYKSGPPLDTLLPINIFRINPPRFVDVITKRFELIMRDITAEDDKEMSFVLRTGTIIKYPNSDIGRYLKVLLKSIFHPSRRIRLFLEAITGRNVRVTLQMFAHIVMSGFVEERRLLKIAQTGEGFLPDRLILRAIMRTNYRYFADAHGYIQNIFWLNESSNTMNNYLLAELLYYLFESRKKETGLAVEGYILVHEIMVRLGDFGYTASDIGEGLNLLVKKGLIVAENQSVSSVDLGDYVKITASGYVHLKYLTGYLEYLSSIALDTWIPEENKARLIANKDYDNLRNSCIRFKILKDYLCEEYARLIEVFPAYRKSGAKLIVDKLSRVSDYISSLEKNLGEKFDYEDS